MHGLYFKMYPAASMKELDIRAVGLKKPIELDCRERASSLDGGEIRNDQ
jgi:hypothetical protein